MALPIAPLLPDIAASLRAVPRLVLVAPPGAGKTTAVAPALLGEAWLGNTRILLLSPRRLAARAAAERMAALRGERVGETIGLRTRLETRVSAATRIEVLTEGIFTRLIQADPELGGIGCVLFDEVHERSLDCDFGLALALDAQAGLRPELRLVAMSATLDGARFAEVMHGAPMLEAEGRSFPVEIRYRPRAPAVRVEDAAAAAIAAALAEEEGGILTFLPGAAEIERTAERLRLPEDVDLHRLYGALPPGEQRAAIAPATHGRRKLVLATSIAETSLTLDGVRVVIDSGLARRGRYDRSSDMTRLVTERASQAAVTQRAGRAGRTQPGVAIRLWEAAATAGLAPFDPPALLEADLSGLLLDCLIWGVDDPARLRWIDAPPRAAIEEAHERLVAMGAVRDDGSVTAHGRAIALLPLAPRQAHALLRAHAQGLGATAALALAVLGEAGAGGRSADLEVRVERVLGGGDARSRGLVRMAAGWARSIGSAEPVDAAGVGAALAAGFPDRIARRRGGAGSDYLLAAGRAVRLPDGDALAGHEWLVVADASGAAESARILAAAAIDRGIVDVVAADALVREDRCAFDPASGGVVAERRIRLGSILLGRSPLGSADPDAVAAALLGAVRERGIDTLAWSEAAASLRARVAFLRAAGESDLPDLCGDALDRDAELWLLPHLTGLRRLDAVDAALLDRALAGLIDWPAQQRIDRLAPPRLATPAGSSHAIDYTAPGGPRVEVRVQSLFGLTVHPTVLAGRAPLTLALLSPAGRPIQLTRDLPGFWAGSWADVKREMKGRYPRHPWPDDPANAQPTLKTRRAAPAP